MKTSIIKVALMALSLAVMSACSLAPVTPRVDAASIGKNNSKLESNYGPTFSFSAMYGLTDNLDLGLDLEQGGFATAWTRYSFINNPDGVSFAGTAAVYNSENDIESNGVYAGLLASNQFNSSVRLTAGIRYAVLDYEYGDFSDNGWFSSPDYLEFDNPDDASHNAQADISLSWRVRPHIELAIGAACQYLVKNEDVSKDNERCAPVVGLSFFRL